MAISINRHFTLSRVLIKRKKTYVYDLHSLVVLNFKVHFLKKKMTFEIDYFFVCYTDKNITFIFNRSRLTQKLSLAMFDFPRFGQIDRIFIEIRNNVSFGVCE